MDAFGYYRVTGLLHKDNLPAKTPEATVKQWLFLFLVDDELIAITRIVIIKINTGNNRYFIITRRKNDS